MSVRPWSRSTSAPPAALLALLVGALLVAAAALAVVAAPSASASALTSYELRGVVRGADGAPVAGAGVELYAYPTDSRGPQFVRSGLTDATGAFSVPATGGRYTVFFSDREGPRVLERREPVLLDHLTTPLDVTLSDAARPRTVTGRVVDEAGEPLAGTPVLLYHLLDRGPARWRYVVEAASTTTGPDGGYTLRTADAGGLLGVGAARPDGTVVGTTGGEVADAPGLVARTPQVDAGALVLSATAPSVPQVTLAGTPAVGSRLSANPVDLAPGAVDVVITWLRDGTPVASGRRYRPTGADLGHEVAALVRATVGRREVRVESAPVRVGRATSRTTATPSRARVVAGRPSSLAVRVRSASGESGRVVVRSQGRTVGVAPHAGETVTRVPVRVLSPGRRTLRVRYTGDALTHGSADSLVLDVLRHR